MKHIIVNQKFTNHVSNLKWIKTNETHIIVNQKFTNHLSNGNS
jgi:hypothetical protein